MSTKDTAREELTNTQQRTRTRWTTVHRRVGGGIGAAAFVAAAATFAPIASDAGTRQAAGQLAIAPIAGTHCFIGEGFGAPRPGGRLHRGVDIIETEGVPLLAVVDGTIHSLTPAERGPRSGNQLVLRDDIDGTIFYYIHLRNFADGIEVGDSVKIGDVVGYVGKTGNTTTPHLHFQIHPYGGEPVDPVPYIKQVRTCGSKPVTMPAPPTTGGPTTSTTPAKPTTTTAAAKPTTTTARATTTTIAVAKPTTTTAKPTTTVAKPTTTTVAAKPTSTVATPSTIAPSTTSAKRPTTTGAALNAVVVRNRFVGANKSAGLQVVGFPGLPANAKTVTLTFQVAGATGARAAAWPCGQRAGIDKGTALAVTPTGASTRVTLAVGERNRVCYVATADTTITVTVHGIGR